MQNHYNLLYREDEREMIPLCHDLGVALVPYSPLAAGRLARDWHTHTSRSQSDAVAKSKYDKTAEQDQMIAQRVAELAERKHASRAQIALAWLWKKGVVAPIVGVTKEVYLDDYMGAFEVSLSDEEIAYLEECYLPHQIVGAV